MFVLYRKDHHRKFHEKWLEYRCLAEFIRPLQFLALFGRSYRYVRSAGAVEQPLSHTAPERCWTYIQSQILARAVGFNQTLLQDPVVDIRKHYVMTHWLTDQINYHATNATTMSALATNLKHWSTTLFFVTLTAVTAKLAVIGVEAFFDVYAAKLSLILGLAAAICPILATAAFSISNHAEFEISAQRSLVAGNQLEAHRRTHYEARLTVSFRTWQQTQTHHASLNSRGG